MCTFWRRIPSWLTLSALLAAAAFAQSSQALMSKLQWRSVGPSVGGRVVAVAGVPQNPNLFYMGTVGGGIWKSTDYGLQWKNISDRTLPGASASIGAIAVAPSDPKVLYAGTGECDIRNDMITGDGIFKSSDGGKSWQYAGLRDARTTCALAIDPQNPDVVYAASLGQVFVPNSAGGVYKTTDGGQNWTKILSGNDTTGAIDLVMQPGQPQVLYAVLWQAQREAWGLTDGGPGSGLYKSTDGGATWTNLTRNPGMPEGIIGRIGVAVTAADPQRVYAIVEAKKGGVFRSSDGGATWTRVNQDWMLRIRSFYYTALYADPKDADVIYAPQVSGLYVSRNGGKTFERLHPPHGDNHIVWVNPHDPKILLEGNDGGATVSTDGGQSWSSEDNQPTGEMYHVNLDGEFPYHIYGAQQDEGSTEAPSAMPGGRIPLSAWKQVAGGESTHVVPVPGEPWINFGSGYFELFTSQNRRTGEVDDVTPEAEMHDGAAAGAMPYRFGWTHAITFSPVNPKQLFLGAQYVFESFDLGRTWKRISPDLTRNDPATEVPAGGPVTLDQTGAETYPGLQTIAVSPLDGKVIWAGSDDGLAHVTRDGGKTWQAVTPPQLPAPSWISCIEPSYAAAGTAYLTARRYMWNDYRPFVYRTTDYGETWTPLVNGLPADAYVFDLRQDPDAPNLLFLGTNSNVEVSLDGGQLWQPLTLNLPTVQVRDLRIDRRQGQMVIATHGRAFWVLDNLALLEQLSQNPTAGASSPFVFAPQTAWLSPAYGGGRRASSSTGENPPFGATVFLSVPADYTGSTPTTLSFANPQGQTIRSFTLHLKKPAKKGVRQTPEQRLTAIAPGMNRFQWDLRYPNATGITGAPDYKPPVGVGVNYSLAGPVITPGQYTVTLDYGGQKQQQSFLVSLDPRLRPPAGALAAQLALQLQIHSTLNELDEQINRALAARNRLQKTGNTAAAEAINRALEPLVQLQLRGGESDAVFGTRLRLHLAFLAGEVAEGYRAPTPAETAAYQDMAARAATGERALAGAVMSAGATTASVLQPPSRSN
ncbi:MAG: WD40/YVTN/BNR-like repeat-containing protein [Terriglobales bacterium]